MFPDDVEIITMTRQDYDRHMENLIYENVDLKQRIDKAIEYIESNSEKLEDEEMNVTYGIGDDFYLNDILDILKGEKDERI